MFIHPNRKSWNDISGLQSFKLKRQPPTAINRCSPSIWQTKPIGYLLQGLAADAWISAWTCRISRFFSNINPNLIPKQLILHSLNLQTKFKVQLEPLTSYFFRMVPRSPRNKTPIICFAENSETPWTEEQKISLLQNPTLNMKKPAVKRTSKRSGWSEEVTVSYLC